MQKKIILILLLLINSIQLLQAKSIVTPYKIAHRMLPLYFFENKDDFLNYLSINHVEFINNLMDKDEIKMDIDSILKPNSIKYSKEEFNNLSVTILEFPKPKQSPDAYFIAMVKIKFDTLEYYRYFTLEKMINQETDNIERSVLCEWNKDKTHRNYIMEGFIYEGIPLKDDFLSMIFKILKKDYNIVDFNYSLGHYDNLGHICLSKGEYTKALKFFIKALEIRKKTLGKEHLDVAISYNNLGKVYNKIGNYLKSIIFFEKSLNIQKKTVKDKNLLIAYTNLAYAYQNIGDYSKSLKLYKKILSFVENIDNWIEKAIVYDGLGVFYREINEYFKSLEYYKKSLTIYEKNIGDTNEYVANIHAGIGMVYDRLNENKKALFHLKKSLIIREKLGAKLNISTSYINLGAFYEKLGDYQKSLKYHKKAIAIRKKILGENNIYTANSYSHLGLIYDRMQQYSKAFESHQKALSIQEKILGKEHIATAMSYNNIGLLYRRNGSYSTALTYLIKSLDIRRKIFGEEHIIVARGYGNIASLFADMGDYTKALKYEKKSLSINKKILGDKNPNVSINYKILGKIYFEKKDYKRYYNYSKLAFNIFINNKNKDFTILNKEKKKSYLKSNTPIYNFFNSAYLYIKKIKDKNKLKENIFNNWLNYKRTIFDMENNLKILYTQTKNKTIKSKINELNTKKRQLARLYQNIPQEQKKLKQYNQKIKQLEEKISNLEIFLSSKSSDLYTKNINYQDITKILKKDELYIDFAKMDDYYYYFTLNKKGNITFEQLDKNQTKAIDQAIVEIQNETQKIVNYEIKKVDTKKSKKQYAKLYNLIFGNIDIKDKTSLIISPDGLLGVVPFEAFYDNKEQKYLIEKLNIRYIPSGKELVKLYQNRTKSNEDITVFANPNFGLTQKQINKTDNVRRGIIDALYDEANRNGRKNKFFNSLLGSIVEADSIISIFRDNEPKIYMRDNANEENLLNIKAPKILHLSTHGFFIKDKDILNPMLKSGIALSGANYAIATKTGNGIVTGLELSGINLNGTELVVLSACETGVGDVEEVEGVAGLSKAFMKAGVKHIVMSLWSVDDKATATLMENFYQNIKDGKSYSVALREAKLSMIKSRKSHPYYWSAFIGSGRD